jgi:hypothetical protein
MQIQMARGSFRPAGTLCILAGVTFFLTVTYLFTVLSGAGLDLEMFDDAKRLLPWVAAHSGLYQGLWLLYFVSQVFLLPVPLLACRWVAFKRGAPSRTAEVAAVFGLASVVLACVGLIVIHSSTPLVARAFVAGSNAALLLHDLFADTGKALRLFSELLLGLWLMGLAWALRPSGSSSSGSGQVGPVWLLGVLGIVGVYTLAVAGIKILDPFNGLEDSLAFLLALVYVALGVQLWREA